MARTSVVAPRNPIQPVQLETLAVHKHLLIEYLFIAETCSAFGCLLEHSVDTNSMADGTTIYFLYCRDTLESQVTRKLRKIKKFLDPLSAKERRKADWRSLIQRKPRKRGTT